MLDTEIGGVKINSKKVEEFFSPILAGKRKDDLIAKEVLANNLTSTTLPRYMLEGAIDLENPALNVASDGTELYPMTLKVGISRNKSYL